ncbi:Calcineurin-binding protein 1, partial [Bienertia sinuspersici]
EHKDILASENSTPRSIERRHKVQFADWVRNHMVVRNQAKTMKNCGKGNGRTLSVVDSECFHNVLGDNFITNEIGSTTNSPANEEVANDNQKHKYGSNFTSRLQVCLTAHEAENLTPREGNCVDENPPKRVRTKYMHENRLHERQGTKLNDPNSSEASTTSAKRKKGQRGKYRSLALEKKTMGGLFKLDVHILDYVLQAVGKITIAFMDAEDWRDEFAKHGHSMWLQVKDKFNIKDSTTNLLRLEAFVTDAMQRLYRFWKARLHYYYKECGDTLEERINNPPTDFPIESWKACRAKFDDEKFKTETNDNVLPDLDVVWLAEHTTLDGEGVLKWVNDGRSEDIHAQLHQLVKDKDKEPKGNESRPRTQEEMLLHVLGPKSGYTRGKVNGYRGSAKARLQEEQQKIIQNQQDQISNLQNLLEANRKAIDDYKEKQRQNMAAMEKRFIEMITRNNRCDDNL